MATNPCRVLLVGASLLVLTSCDSLSGPSCSVDPAPQITSAPPTVATVSSLYEYYVRAQYACSIFVCADIVGVQLPPGAVSEVSVIRWTPPADQANRDVRFVIATRTDICGERATQSWTVHVYPAPLASGG